VGASRLRSRLRIGVLAFTRERAARFLVAEREAIIAELERATADYFAPTRSSVCAFGLLEEMSTPAGNGLDRIPTVIIFVVSPPEQHGPPGMGKRHLVQAIGFAVIQQGHRVRDRETPVLLEALAEGQLAEGRPGRANSVLRQIPEPSTITHSRKRDDVPGPLG
jgi:hypothetical protein